MTVAGTPPGFRGALRALTADWSRRDRLRFAALVGTVVLMHLVGFGTLVLLIAPRHYPAGTETFGVGLGVTAYLLGLRHGFDADHIAAIDNTTRKLMADGQKPTSTGFWFAMGHSSVVLAMAVLVAAGARSVGTLLDEDSPARHALSLTGTLVSGLFLYLIAVLNILALTGIVRAYRRLRSGHYRDEDLEQALNDRGLLARLLRPILDRVTHSAQLYPVGLLFGLGFDTATEVAVLALAGTGAAVGLPWHAVLVLPLLFAAGMALVDTADGLLMTAAYDWAFLQPARKIYYNFTITGLSIAVAVLIGTIELTAILHERLELTDPVTGWVSGISLNNAGVALVALFALTWAGAVGYWKLGDVERRWAPRRRPDPSTD